jgi:GABA(A) receptor-associated protein
MLKYVFYNVQKPVKVDYDFKVQNSFDKRKNYSDKIRQEHLNMVPIIVEKAGTNDVQQIRKSKFLINKNIKVGEFLLEIRRQLNIDSKDSMFLFVNNKVIPSNNDRLETLYKDYMDADGFLYITYSLENVFG